MVRTILFSSLFFLSCHTHAQNVSEITEPEVSRIEKTLASDDMQGRKVFTSGIEKAAGFIASEFSKAGLVPLAGAKDFRQTFSMVKAEVSESSVMLDGRPLDKNKLIVLSDKKELLIKPENHYTKIIVKEPADFGPVVFKYLDSKENVLVFVDSSLSMRFNRLAGLHMPQFNGNGNRIFILTSGDPVNYEIRIKQNLSKQELTNIAGMIPGKSRPREFVIFSAHYDHLGIGKADIKGDSIYNGANDDASGTTAVIALASYFGKKHANERSLIFTAFTAEEIGEFGSAYFARQLNPADVIAMFNIEMIGTESKWGKNSAYITGFDQTDMGSILQQNLQTSPFKFYPDPYPAQQLFLRSDNASLAKLGVPAHTISTSKMDSEKTYHTVGDNVETLDLANMTEIIRAIALSAEGIIDGKSTPLRVKTNQ